MFNHQQTFNVLCECGVSLGEYYVMGTVAYGIFLSPENLARQSFKLAESDPRGNPSEKEHFEAIFSCINKQWLEVVKSERQKGDYLLDVGTIDFTPEGFALYRQIANKLFGDGFVIGYETL